MRLFRSQAAVFEKTLKDSKGESITPATKVIVRITNPIGEVVSQGPAVKNLDNQAYNFRFIVPKDAMYSTLDSPWHLDWSFGLADGKTLDIVVEFDVVAEDPKLPDNDIILTEKSKEYIPFYLPEKATTIQLDLIDRLNNKYMTLNKLTDFQITPVEHGYIYQICMDTTTLQNYMCPDNLLFNTSQNPALPDNLAPFTMMDSSLMKEANSISCVGDYLFKLTAVLTNRITPHTEIVRVRIVPLLFWQLYPSMQMFLDKARKKVDLVQSYTKGDIYEYLQRGVALLNVTPPMVTGWTLPLFPIGDRYSGGFDLSDWLIKAASCWGLQAQTVMYGELNFDFTGQTIGLGYDPSSAINGIVTNLLDQLNNNFPKTKELFLRRTQKTAIAGVRRQFYNQGLSRLDTLRRALDIQLNYVNQPISGLYLPVG